MKVTLTFNNMPPIPLTSARYLIGRGDGCDILLPEDDGAVSRRHALLERDSNEDWSIIDLHSSNGTVVNGRKILDKRILIDGDRISVGKSVMTMSVPRQAPTIHAAVHPSSEQNRHPPSMRTEDTILPDVPVNRSPLPKSVSHSQNYLPSQSEDSPYDRHAISKSPLAFPSAQNDHFRNQYPEQHLQNLAGHDVQVNAGLQHSTPSQPVVVTPSSSIKPSDIAMFIGAGLLAISLLSYFAWVQPRLEQNQSAVGLLQRGFELFTKQTTMEQEYQMLVWESRACIVGGLIGGTLLIFGLIKRR